MSNVFDNAVQVSKVLFWGKLKFDGFLLWSWVMKLYSKALNWLQTLLPVHPSWRLFFEAFSCSWKVSIHPPHHHHHHCEVIGSFCNWAPYQFLPHIRIEIKRSINSVVSLGQIYLVDPISIQVKSQPISFNLKAYLGHNMWPPDSIGELSTLSIDSSLGSTMMPYHQHTSCGVQFTPLFRMVVDLTSNFYCPNLVFNPTGFLATLFTRRAWWGPQA